MSDASSAEPGWIHGSEPDPVGCRGPSDVGKIHHDDERGIWYECVFDERTHVYTWTILPSGDAFIVVGAQVLHATTAD